MRKQEKIIKNIESNKELMSTLNKMDHYSIERFIDDAQCYIKAIKDRRMINSIGSVASSGMSRTMKFLSCEPITHDKTFYYRNYFQFFRALGFKEADKHSHYFRIHGCGMDMVFYTNYRNIHNLHRLGMITKEECEKLAQATPQTI